MSQEVCGNFAPTILQAVRLRAYKQPDGLSPGWNMPRSKFMPFLSLYDTKQPALRMHYDLLLQARQVNQKRMRLLRGNGARSAVCLSRGPASCHEVGCRFWESLTETVSAVASVPRNVSVWRTALKVP